MAPPHPAPPGPLAPRRSTQAAPPRGLFHTGGTPLPRGGWPSPACPPSLPPNAGRPPVAWSPGDVAAPRPQGRRASSHVPAPHLYRTAAWAGGPLGAADASALGHAPLGPGPGTALGPPPRPGSRGRGAVAAGASRGRVIRPGAEAYAEAARLGAAQGPAHGRAHAGARSDLPGGRPGATRWAAADPTGGPVSPGDDAAVKAGITRPWRQGPIEGQRTRLTVRTRPMVGRAHVDLLAQRFLLAA
jgi:hypothetical protein